MAVHLMVYFQKTWKARWK